jgi:hypothetical protein
MMGFIIGLIVGGAFGVFIMALIIGGTGGDDEE